ncbi:MAG TPA: transglycosylase SLT domain-containing protein [Gemmatimonadaceae bacterium]|nr:transglycosylase SLT domain-containing protein [Gemmatimonadaceae bacterium]
MDRDLRGHMLALTVHALMLAAALACRQGEPRESAGEVATALPLRPPPVSSPDPDVRRAQDELADGRAALASRIVMPVLRTAERRTPEAVLVAARAASEWDGWDLVTAMLKYEPWLSSRFGGEGLELLARGALERGNASEARSYAEAALRVPTTVSSRAMRLVLLARALDRLNVRDSAATLYAQAAQILPGARDWLLLRAAGLTDAKKDREQMYAQVRGVAARGRVPYTEAQTLERLHLDVAAADAYEKLGDIPSAYRLRLASDYDAALRSGLRSGLLGYIQRDARGDDLARALEVLDAAFPALDATSQLLVTRRAADGGQSARAVKGFARVPPSLLTDSDVLTWARALVTTGHPTEAAARIKARRFGAAAAPEAAYVRAWALVRAGSTTAARTALSRVAATYASSRYAADAWYLLADMESDAGRDTRARDLLQRSCVHRPAGSYSDDACFRAGILYFALGDAKRAATAFDELPARFPNSPDLVAARYWSGRAWQRMGKLDVATQRWRSVLSGEPLSYYAVMSAKRLDTTQWIPHVGAIPPSPMYQAAVNRAAVLRLLGMDVEEDYEYQAIEDSASRSPALALGAGAALLEQGESVRAIRLGWKAVVVGRAGRDSSVRADERGYALVYPLLHEVELLARSRENNLDPALVAAVIRQESSWNPRAVSRAGARGLMQIMPPVGREIAASRGYPLWDADLLFDPDVSLELGTSHLKAALSEYGSNLPRALAAYNAGSSRVRRWSRRAGAADPELFTERIPFTETRDYVRIVLRNAEMYRGIHGLKK